MFLQSLAKSLVKVFRKPRGVFQTGSSSAPQRSITSKETCNRSFLQECLISGSDFQRTQPKQLPVDPAWTSSNWKFDDNQINSNYFRIYSVSSKQGGYPLDLFYQKKGCSSSFSLKGFSKFCNHKIANRLKSMEVT